MEIKLTPEWILDKLSETIYGEGNGDLTIWAYPKNSDWIELALKTLGIKSKGKEFFDEFHHSIWRYELTLEQIKSTCPNLYKALYKLSLKKEKFVRK